MTETQHTRPAFMGVYAHPDDEVFGTGGTFALLASRGVHTVLLTATLGEEGEIVDPDLDEAAKQAMFPRLAEVRRQELQAAADALNVRELRILGYRDSGMAGTEANRRPDAFHRVTFDDAVKQVVAAIRQVRPQVLVTFDAFGGYGHPDHIQIHRVTNAAFDAAADSRCFPDLDLEPWQVSKLYYNAMPRSFFVRAMEEARKSGESGPWDNPAMRPESMGTPDELITTRIDVRAFLDNKMKAFRAHKTQIAPDNFIFKLTAEQQEQGFGYEHFVLARRAPARHEGVLEQDMFADLG